MTNRTQENRTAPPFQVVMLGTHRYAIMNGRFGQEKAKAHLEEALLLMQQGPDDEATEVAITHALTEAIDYGCREAPFLLAKRILTRSEAPGPCEDAIVYLKMAAERGHVHATHWLARIYAGMSLQRPLQGIIQCDAKVAVQYFEQAIAAGHQEALEDLIMAYSYGRGNIKKDAKAFIELCEREIARGNQSVALGYGAWLAGTTVGGTPPLPEAISIPVHYEKAFNHLTTSLNGADPNYARQALFLICEALPWEAFEAMEEDDLHRRLTQAVERGNTLVALYLAWYHLPRVTRPNCSFIEDRPVPALERVLTPSLERAKRFAAIATKSANGVVSVSAQGILTALSI